MDEKEFKKYVELIMSMCTDFLMDGIDRKTFESNLKMLSERIQEETKPPSDAIFVTNDTVGGKPIAGGGL
jgi:hypothetical protein